MMKRQLSNAASSRKAHKACKENEERNTSSTEQSYEEAVFDEEAESETSLPLKFRFEDEVPKKVEKTEYEKMVDGLWSEFDIQWSLVSNYPKPEVDEEDENPPAQETQHDRCNRGKHELVTREDEGKICIFCHHVAVGPKDIMPDWAEETTTHRERKRCPRSRRAGV